MLPRDTSSLFIRALGQVVRAERLKLGWSQEELCEKADLDRTYLSGVERGVRSPNLRTILRVAAALNMRLSRLVLAAESKREPER